MAFLDVLVNCDLDKNISTTVYRKPTNDGICLNQISECPLRYKLSVLTSFLKRAYTVCSDWRSFNTECKRIKQILINNGYSNNFVDNNIKHFLDRIEQPGPTVNPVGQTKKLFYCNQFHAQYQDDERAIKQIIRDNVKTSNINDRISLVVYYQNRKTKNLIITNNLAAKKVRTLAKTHLIYQFSCPHGECTRLNGKSSDYIGYTSCTLSRRLSFHLQNGSIKEHYASVHQSKITRTEIVENTTIRYFERDLTRLRILEALIIKQEVPIINSQDTGFSRTLRLFKN